MSLRMKKNDVIEFKETCFRVLAIERDRCLLVNCENQTVPKWYDCGMLKECHIVEDIYKSVDVEELEPVARKEAYKRYELVSGVLPFLRNARERHIAISRISEQRQVSKQTINKYLWKYLVYQNASALAPMVKSADRELTDDAKNFRWALNKYFYTPDKLTLTTVYERLLKERYCDDTGELFDRYPSFHQFRYFYRKHRKLQNYYISRDTLSDYKRNTRPLLGGSVAEYCGSAGRVGMLDATICDIFLVSENGVVIGRPILTICVDGYSGLCLGYALTLEGGVYSLRGLLLNVVTDKKEYCKKFGIEISKDEWPSSGGLPLVFWTDNGKEYLSETVMQLTELGCRFEALPSYSPQQKSRVEKCFDLLQNLYLPHLKGMGSIEKNYQERGAINYQEQACLTFEQFEKILIHCIVLYNSKTIVEKFPYSEEMLDAEIQPFRNTLWEHSMSENGQLISVTEKELILTLLPRTSGTFTRSGLVANGIKYRNIEGNYTENYLSGGSVTVAYNPEDVSFVWLIEAGRYIAFELIEKRFEGKTCEEVSGMKEKQKTLIENGKKERLQSKIDLATHIETIAGTKKTRQGKAIVKGVIENRQAERRKTHRDYVKEVKLND